MRAHFANAAYGALDYAAYPVGMLVVAPLVLRHLGMAQFGVWTVTTAAVNAGSIIASGFGDANIQHVASKRITGDPHILLRAVRSTMGIHVLLGMVMAATAWSAAPAISSRMASSDPEIQTSCLWCLRIAALLMFVRAIESVCVSTQRAFERYGAAVRISILARLLSLMAAAVISAGNRSVVMIMEATAALTILGLCAQLARLKGLLQADSLTPSFDPQATRALVRFGMFSWLLAVSGVFFSQADRLIGGASLGAAAVVSYALCTQLAQPIYGLSASGLHFVFPYLARQRDIASSATLRKPVIMAFVANLVIVLGGTSVLLVWGTRLLNFWVGKSIANSCASLLPVIALSSAALGLSVTGSYAMLALGRVQIVTWLNVVGGAAMLLFIAFLLPRYGINTIAASRLLYGSITLLIYFPLVHMLRRSAPNASRISIHFPTGEEV